MITIRFVETQMMKTSFFDLGVKNDELSFIWFTNVIISSLKSNNIRQIKKKYKINYLIYLN